MKLRPYQNHTTERIYAAWSAGSRNVLAVLPTGAGKTVTFASIVHAHKGASCCIAHRQELVSQISLALAREGVRHRIVGPRKVIKMIVHLHLDELGQSFYDPQALPAVAGIDTLVKRGAELKGWLEQVSLVVQDEAHHVLKANKWGKGIAMFPNAFVLGVTATPLRADGKGLGMHADGIFETMIVGPTMRELIDMKFLTEYRIFAPKSEGFDRSTLETAADGDFKKKQMSAAVEHSQIIGDVVKHYQKIAHGKRGITFAPDVKIATDIAAQFNAAGIPAEVLSAKTDDRVRSEAKKRLERGEILQLVNVDLFGEGFDLPAIEVVSFARPTQSYALYVQQFGRVLRLLRSNPDKVGIIIDHVGNCTNPLFGLPDAPPIWSLDRREKRGKPTDVIPVKACDSCAAVYERIYSRCPFCGSAPKPPAAAGGRPIEFVDGDLCELSPQQLATMRGEIAKADGPGNFGFLDGIARAGAEKTHRAMQHMQRDLRQSIALWAGYQKEQGRPLSEMYRRFFFKFGTDVGTAQTLKRKEAEALNQRITNHIEELDHARRS